MGRTRSQQQKAISRKRKREEIDGNKKRWSNNGGTGIDELPDDVLINILSHARLKEAARTSVLAHRWRYLWRFSHRILQFYNNDTATRKIMKRQKFESWVNTVLELYQAQYVESVVIGLDEREDGYLLEEKRDPYRINPTMYDSWVDFAIQKEVPNFELNILFDGVYRFPSVDRLKSHSHGVSAPLCRLRTFRLANVAIKDETVHYFLASCPNLEELSIHQSELTRNLRVIDPPSLRVLEISTCYRLQKLEISAAGLISLTYRGLREMLLLKKIPNLRELSISHSFSASMVLAPNIHCSYTVQLEKLVLDFRFCIDSTLDVIPHLPEFSSLKRLEVFALRRRTVLVFTPLIKASPQLREFRIEMDKIDYSSFTGDIMIPFHARKAGMRFVHRNLKVLEIGGYTSCQGEEELVLALIKIGRVHRLRELSLILRLIMRLSILVSTSTIAQNRY